jgi:Phage integrase family
MEENPEIKSLKQMVKNWKAGYLSQVDDAGDNEYLLKDFWEEIEENILPFVESVGFARWAFQQVKDLERLIKEIESNSLSIDMNLRSQDRIDLWLYIISRIWSKQSEIVFIPKKVADRLKDYIRAEELTLEQRVFPLSYSGAREIVKKAGRLVGINLSPHDLRRHAATYASRTGAPLEIVSKVIHHTTLPWKNQRYRSHSVD